MSQNIDLQFNLKADNSDLRSKLRESESDIKTMGESMFSKKALGDPSAEAKKFLDQFATGIGRMKNDKRFDIMSHLMEQMNDPGTSMQSKTKMAKRMQTMLEDMNMVMRSKMREFQDKGKLAGFSPEAISEGMKHGLGQTGEMWMNSGDYANQLKNSSYGSGGDGDGAGGKPKKSDNPLDGRDEISKYARKAATYLVGYMVADVIKNAGGMYQSMQSAEANIFQRAGTTFDLNSVMQTGLQTSAMHRENIMQGLQIRKQGYEVGGSLGGLAAGIGVGALLAPFTGGLSMGIAPMIGSAIGGEVGGIFGTKDITDKTREQTEFIAKDKMVGELMGMASQRVGMFDQMEVARSKFGARTGTTNVGGSGTGYTQAELYALGLQQEGVTGHFDKSTFTDQLRFSRAYGYDPSQIFSAGVSTRYTGQQVGASELFARKDLAEKTGMGSRLPELIAALNSLAGVMTKVGANVTESSMMQAANLPYLLFGDTARGRMGDMGMETLMGVNNMFNQSPGSAGDAFLYQAMKPKDLWDFKLRKEQGIFGEGNLESVMNYTSKFKSPQLAKHMFSAMGVESPALVEAFVNKGFNKDGSVNKDFLEKFNKIDVNTEEGTQRMADLLQVSKEAVSGAEKQKQEMVAAMVKTGEKIATSVREMQLNEVKMQNAVLTDKAAWDIITATWTKSVFDFQQAVNKLLGLDVKESKDTVWNLQRDPNGYGADVLKKLGKENYELGEVGNEQQMRILMTKMKEEGQLTIPYSRLNDGSYKYVNIKDPEKAGIMMDRVGEIELPSERRIQAEWDYGATERPKTEMPKGEGQGDKGHTIIFNINAASRAGIHSQIDRHLDDLELMAHPSKLASNF